MTWRDIWKRLVLLWRSERNWRKGVRIPECRKCGSIMIEETRSTVCAECIATSGVTLLGGAVYVSTLAEQQSNMAHQLMAQRMAAMQNVQNPYDTARLGNQQSQLAAGGIGNALGGLAGGIFGSVGRTRS